MRKFLITAIIAMWALVGWQVYGYLSDVEQRLTWEDRV